MLLLVGTAKGGFVLEGNASRRNWKLHGPFFDGFETYDMVADSSQESPFSTQVSTLGLGVLSFTRAATWA